VPAEEISPRRNSVGENKKLRLLTLGV